MNAELLAISAAIAFALSGITVRKALLRHPYEVSALLAFITGTVILWVIVLVKSYELPQINASLLFALRGAIDPGIVAFLFFIGFRRLGLAITVPIIGAAPLVSTAIAIVFLDERLTLFIALGTLLIIGGVGLLTFKAIENKINKKYLLIVAAGAILIAINAVITKIVLTSSPTPISGTAVSFTVGVLVQILIIGALGKFHELPKTMEKAKLFVLAGIFSTTAFIFYNFAFLSGKVSVVFPLIGTQPLFVLMFSWILLRQQEKLTKNVVLGTIMIVVGAALLSFL